MSISVRHCLCLLPLMTWTHIPCLSLSPLSPGALAFRVSQPTYWSIIMISAPTSVWASGWDRVRVWRDVAVGWGLMSSTCDAWAWRLRACRGVLARASCGSWSYQVRGRGTTVYKQLDPHRKVSYVCT
ncbi:hypothetical protein OF83DRAFT_1160597 [Amylostereum chailletii]|nr:hypothetical protein OF83DRAFT_1160597 [Amylostereum chailletii]